MKRQERLKYKAANKRTLAFVLLLCFICASLLLGAFILTHTDHQHDHNGAHGACETCVQIQNAQNVLRLFSTAAALSFVIFAVHCAAGTLIGAIYSNIAKLTPITARTRMNN